MEQRRLTAVIAVLVLAIGVGFLAYFEVMQARKPAETASAQSTETPTPATPAPSGDTAPASTTVAAEAPVAGTLATETPAATGGDVAMINPIDTEPSAGAPSAPSAGSTAAASAPGVPTFDVVRVEPTGEAVIAGQATAESKVEVLDGSTPIATAQADEQGEWALTLDKPLPPGPHDLALRTTSKDETVATLSDQRVTVSVPEKGSKDVLVVVNTPDAASKVIQVPGAEASAAPATDTLVASAPAAGAETKTPATKMAPASAVSGTETAAAPAGETPDATAPAQGTETQQTTLASNAEAPAAAPAGTAAATGAEQQVASAPASSSPAEAPITTESPVKGETPIAAEKPVQGEAPVASEAPIKPEAPVTTEAPLVAKAPPPPPQPEVAVAAVEADTAGSVYVAGTVATGETVRVYLDDKPLGDAHPSPSGTWLVETKRDLPAGKYTVRADQVDATGNVIARSEVPFEREVEVALLKPTGLAGGETGATITGAMPEMETVIIKRGDNLWRIARGAWGKGMRWSTIYQANNDQIRNPNRIYPGQVFIMPKGDVSWTD